jgi:Ca2+-binding EF-hand superfamily protein
MKFNPFRPNSIATDELFQGRSEEMQFIEKSLFQTKNGNPQHFLVEGERGLGKSSLFLRVTQQAKGEKEIGSNVYVNFIVLNVELETTHSFFDIVRVISLELKNAISEREKLKMLASSVWDFLSSWEILGVKYNKLDAQKNQPYEVLNDLVNNLSKLIIEAKQEIDGILILLDEADRPTEQASLGEILKLITEKLTKKNCDKVLVGITGQPGLVAKLKASHESASRIFTILHLNPLSESENNKVLESGLKIANKVNVEKTKFEDEAIDLIYILSEGYPHFLQEFAFMAFDADEDGSISTEDVKKGAYGDKGALNQLGEKYFHDLYFTQIASDDYRRVLQAMANFSDDWVNREKIKSLINIKDTILNNAIQALKTRGIILANPTQQGSFRLPTKSFAAWIKAYNKLDESI